MPFRLPTTAFINQKYNSTGISEYFRSLSRGLSLRRKRTNRKNRKHFAEENNKKKKGCNFSNPYLASSAAQEVVKNAEDSKGTCFLLRSWTLCLSKFKRKNHKNTRSGEATDEAHLHNSRDPKNSKSLHKGRATLRSSKKVKVNESEKQISSKRVSQRPHSERRRSLQAASVENDGLCHNLIESGPSRLVAEPASVSVQKPVSTSTPSIKDTPQERSKYSSSASTLRDSASTLRDSASCVSTDSSGKRPSLDGLNRLSNMLCRLSTIDDHHLFFEKGKAIIYKIEKSVDEEVDDLIANSRFQPGLPEYEERVEETLKQFKFMFDFLSCCINRTLRIMVLKAGGEIFRFRNSLSEVSRSIKPPSKGMSEADITRYKADLDAKSSLICHHFEELVKYWKLVVQELLAGFKYCKMTHTKMTKAYLNFFNWHCSIFLSPKEVAIFHEYYGATHFWKSSQLIVEKKLYSSFAESLTELQDGLSLMLETKDKILGK